MKQRFRTQSIWEREKEIDLIRLEKVSLPLYAFASSHSFFLSLSFFQRLRTGVIGRNPSHQEEAPKGQQLTNKSQRVRFSLLHPLFKKFIYFVLIVIHINNEDDLSFGYNN